MRLSYSSSPVFPLLMTVFQLVRTKRSSRSVPENGWRVQSRKKVRERERINPKQGQERERDKREKEREKSYHTGLRKVTLMLKMKVK